MRRAPGQRRVWGRDQARWLSTRAALGLSPWLVASAAWAPAWAETPAALEPMALPATLELRQDVVHFWSDAGSALASASHPQRERLGLLSASLLLEAAPGWRVGPVVMGANSGQRGGFFVLGGQVQRQWALADRWQAQAALMVGGGGGGNAPVGGGLLVQPSVSLLYDLGGVKAGASWSRINMPSGRIGSGQWGLVLQWDGRVHAWDAAAIGQSAPVGGPTGPDEPGARDGLGLDRLALTAARVRVKDPADGATRDTTTLGVLAERDVGGGTYLSLEAAGAAQGGADGYMEVLVGAGRQWPWRALGWPQVSWGLRGALGLGGGGSQATGGGAMGKLAGTWRWSLTRQAQLGLEAGVVRAASGPYHGPYLQAQAAWQSDWLPMGGASEALQPEGAGTPVPSRASKVEGMAWAAGVSRFTQAQRKSGERLAMELVGLELRREWGAHAYLSGQAWSAAAGRAGAFSMGLAGVGLSTGFTPGWQASAELLGGAAGGGGVDMRGGAVLQGLASVSHGWPGGGQLQLGVGRVHGLKGGLDSPVLSLSWRQRFGARF